MNFGFKNRTLERQLKQLWRMSVRAAIICYLLVAAPALAALHTCDATNGGHLQLTGQALGAATFSIQAGNCTAITISACNADSITFPALTNIAVTIANLTCSAAGSGNTDCILFSAAVSGTGTNILIDGATRANTGGAGTRSVVRFAMAVTAHTVIIRRVSATYTGIAAASGSIVIVPIYFSNTFTGSATAGSKIEVTGSVFTGDVTSSPGTLATNFNTIAFVGAISNVRVIDVSSNVVNGLKFVSTAGADQNLYFISFGNINGGALTDIFVRTNSFINATSDIGTSNGKIVMLEFQFLTNMRDIFFEDNNMDNATSLWSAIEITGFKVVGSVSANSILISNFNVRNVWMAGEHGSVCLLTAVVFSDTITLVGALRTITVSNVRLTGELTSEAAADKGARIVYIRAGTELSTASSITVDRCVIDFARGFRTKTASVPVVARILEVQVAVSNVVSFSVTNNLIVGNFQATGAGGFVDVSIARFMQNVSASAGASDVFSVSDSSIHGSYTSVGSYVCLGIAAFDALRTLTLFETTNAVGAAVNAYAAQGAVYGGSWGPNSILVLCGAGTSITSSTTTTEASTTTTTSSTTTTSTTSSSTTSSTTSSSTTSSTTTSSTTTSSTTTSSTTTTTIVTENSTATSSTEASTTTQPDTSTTTTSATTIAGTNAAPTPAPTLAPPSTAASSFSSTESPSAAPPTQAPTTLAPPPPPQTTSEAAATTPSPAAVPTLAPLPPSLTVANVTTYPPDVQQALMVSDASVKTATGVGAAASGFTSANPAAATVAARMGLGQKLIECQLAFDTPLPFYQSPTGLEIDLGTPAVRYHLGGIVANLAITLGFGVISISYAIIHSACTKKPGERTTCGIALRSLGAARFPGALVFPFLFFLQPQIGSSLTALIHGDTKSALVAISVVLVTLFCAAYLGATLLDKQNFLCTYRENTDIIVDQKLEERKREEALISVLSASEEVPGTTATTTTGERLVEWCDKLEGVQGAWFAVPASAETKTPEEWAKISVPALTKAAKGDKGSFFLLRFGAGFDSYNGKHRYFLIPEVISTIILGICDGLIDSIGCINVAFVFVVLFSLYTIAVFCIHPFATRKDFVLVGFITLLQEIGAVLSVIPDSVMSRDQAVTAITVVSSMALIITTVAAAHDLLSNGFKFLVMTLFSSEEDAARASAASDDSEEENIAMLARKESEARSVNNAALLSASTGLDRASDATIPYYDSDINNARRQAMPPPFNPALRRQSFQSMGASLTESTMASAPSAAKKERSFDLESLL